jgi:hypothetical protein
MDLVELGAVLGDFFEDGRGPSHDQLEQAFTRTGLNHGDPAPAGRTRQGVPLGKTKRIRQVLVYATDNDRAAGLELAQQIVALLRADGAFAPALEDYAGSQKIDWLREALPVSASRSIRTGRCAPRSLTISPARSSLRPCGSTLTGST